MKFVVISDAPTLKKDDLYGAYAPYVLEMDMWFKHITDVTVLSPTKYNAPLLTRSFFKQPMVNSVSALNFTSLKNSFISLSSIPVTAFKLFRAFKNSDHIHLRCPGNIGLLGCLIQIFFPKKPKTAKYAGNWDPKAKQPLSYKFQKWILSNTVLTKNMQVLIYGDWPNQSNNIKPFFTATYKNSEIEKPMVRDYTAALKFVFVGTLAPGKQPLLAIQLVEILYKNDKAVTLDLYGDGVLRESLKSYITDHNLETIVTLHGNQPQSEVKEAIKSAHFSILPSKSEGWPKAIAEAMFFGAIPIATPVSCVPYMLDHGNRGLLLTNDFQIDCNNLMILLNEPSRLQDMSQVAAQWSQQYTLDRFEAEIVKLL
ncbi:glycosyltransferase [Tamlana agarivorans]|uniref:Glycosyltransferase n=1 Tax=Pseudotamlana agarivorans TaxID=481183 RepID=A0ACC5UD43_9FLAO|nr:glycosyltransferase [Tamlana agarivorans]MBU2952135.1 glycosyltransferase [Tamlana agarivorans]